MLEGGGPMPVRRPDVSEYPTSHAPYVKDAPEGDILEVLQRQGEEILGMVGSPLIRIWNCRWTRVLTMSWPGLICWLLNG